MVKSKLVVTKQRNLLEKMSMKQRKIKNYDFHKTKMKFTES